VSCVCRNASIGHDSIKWLHVSAVASFLVGSQMNYFILLDLNSRRISSIRFSTSLRKLVIISDRSTACVSRLVQEFLNCDEHRGGDPHVAVEFVINVIVHPCQQEDLVLQSSPRWSDPVACQGLTRACQGLTRACQDGGA
jgi:hypothetical protein